MTYDWLFEPTDPEGARDMHGNPWQHAVRGRKPQRPAVIGYGHTEQAAEEIARRRAQEQDAREVLGERGEVVTTIEYTPMPEEIDFVDARRRMILEICRMYGCVIYEPSTIVNISA